MKTANRTSTASAFIAAFAVFLIAFLMTSTAFAAEIPVSRMSSSGVSIAAGKVNGFSYGGLFWTAEEYSEMTGIERMANPAVISVSENAGEKLDTGINEVFGLSLSDEELEQLSAEISRVTADSEDDSNDVSDSENVRLGMPLTMRVDLQTGENINMDGYKFDVAEGTNMNSLMNKLQKWDFEKSPYKGQFFSKDWTYKTVQVEGGAQAIFVDVPNKVITFNVKESIDELSAWEVLAMQRLAVVKDLSIAAETK